MATDGKFGTFSGVFTPSLLTILGVIMYLRLPWMVGQAGLFVAIGIVLAAHVVSVATGLSVSSIATDKKVGAGGPYYIISRSFGLPIGGAVGVALFLGLSFSVSLYIVGFSQSLLSAINIEPTPDSIRLCGSITLVAITIITFVSTSLAIKAQYLILALVGGSLIAVFLGHSTAATPHMSSAPGSPDFGTLFGIFFPAVTGFMAGVNMSGDLRDPKAAIPKGTMLAIAAGFAVYVGLVVYLALTTDPAALRDDPEVLQHTALWAPAVIAGIWGATLSSALGSILGAPRILQAMSSDRITPRAFAKGYGPTHEPRRALFVAFAIAEAGILIAELNLIARVVSMVFLALYGAINVTCAIESWASPDFRPRFRIPNVVSIIGAVSALLLMIQLDIVAMLGAMLLMVGLFVFLKRRQLTLEAGDTWEGVWATLVRAGLHRMNRKAGTQRNWRPNVLLFDDANHPRHAAIRKFASTLASGNGMVTDFALAAPVEGEETVAAPSATTGDQVGVFDARIVTANPLEAVASVCQYHGFSGLPPNTLLLPWRQHERDPSGFLRTLNTAADRELNILLFEEARAIRPLNQQIDVWWARNAGNLALAVALVRFITRSPEWERAAINVLIVGDGSDDDAVLRAKTARYLHANRVDAKIRLVARPKDETVHDLVCNESSTADLVLLGLPPDLGSADQGSLARLDRVADLPGSVVFLRASTFADALVTSVVPVKIPRVPGSPTPPAGLPALSLPEHPELAAAVTSLLAHENGQLTGVHDRIAAAYGLYLDLCDTARGMVCKRAELMIAAAREPDVGKRRKVLGSATNDFLQEAERALAQITAEGVAAQAILLGEVLGELVKHDAGMPASHAQVIHVERPRTMFRPAADDSRAMRRWKRRCRWRYFYRRSIPQAIPLRPLVARNHEQIASDEVHRIVDRFRTATHELAAEIGRVLATAEWKSHAQLSRITVADPDGVVASVAASRDDACGRLEALSARAREKISEDAVALDAAALGGARALSAVLDRVDAPLAAREAARDRRRSELDGLPAMAEAWRDQQLHLLSRARLGVRLARFRDRLTIASARALGEVVAASDASGRRALVELRDALAKRAAEPDGPMPELREEVPYDGGPPVARLTHVSAVLSGELPETETLLGDDAAAALVRGDAADEIVTVPVRAAVQAIVEAELLTRMTADIVQVAEADARAWAVARETLVLISARPRESDDEETAQPESFDALARLDGQIAKLDEALAACAAGVLTGLQAVASATAIDDMSATLVEHGGRRAAVKTPSRILGLVRRGGSRLRDAAANVIYRRSAGVVYAEEWRAARMKAPEQTIRELTARSTAAASVLAKLPLYYRNLFTGQVNINESFFVGREDNVRTGVEVVTGVRGGGLRTVLVGGSRGSGRTTLCQRIVSASGADVYWVAAPPGGAASRGAVASALETSLGRRGKPSTLLERLSDHAVLVFDDLDLWWERRAGGLDAIDTILELMSRAGDRTGFVLSGSTATLRVLQSLRPLSRMVYTQLDCHPLSARALEKVIMSRHGSTGIGLKLAGRDSFGSWTRARLFDAHFAYAGGNVGYALRSWITHLEQFADDQLTVRVPKLLDWDAIDDLRPEHVALLIELVLHKSATSDKLERVTGRTTAAIEDGLAELTSIGLVVQNRRRIAQLNPYVHVPVLQWLDRRELA